MPSLKNSNEAPWKYMANLDIEDPICLRKVMALIHHVIFAQPRKTYTKRANWRNLPQKDRKQVRTMLQETKGNYLLYSMIHSYCQNYTKSNRNIITATNELRKRATYVVRNRKLYYEEWRAAKKEWIQHLDRHDLNWSTQYVSGDRDNDSVQEHDPNEKQMSGYPDGGGRSLQKALMDYRKSSYGVVYVKRMDWLNAEAEMLTDNEDEENNDTEVDDSWVSIKCVTVS